MNENMTGSMLFGKAWANRFGGPPPEPDGLPGDAPVCAYCGAKCTGRHRSKDWIKSNFTEWLYLCAPQSEAVCGGCVATLTEAADAPLCDGTTRPMTRSAIRQWSWVVTEREPLGASKAHRDWLRSWLTNPPVSEGEPWLASISDGGQRHFLWRTRPNWSRERFIVYLDGEPIETTPGQLRSVLVSQTKIALASGRPTLLEPRPTPVHAEMAAAAWPNEWEALVSLWERQSGRPVWRLGVWLSPGRDDAAAALVALGCGEVASV